MRHALIGLIAAAAVLCASTAMAQTARDIRGPAPVVPLASESAPRIVIDPPLADSLVNGLPAGPHKILIELVNANHQTLDMLATARFSRGSMANMRRQARYRDRLS
jgi:hypothetical protein